MGFFRKSNGTEASMSVNTQGRGDVVQHAHPNEVGFHMHTTVSGSANFVLVDLSDTTNFKHASGDFIHLEQLFVGIDTDNTGDYLLEFGFVEDVNAANADFYSVYAISGNKTVGQNKNLNFNPYPNGPKLSSLYYTSGNVSLDTTGFQNDTGLRSTLYPSEAAVNPGSGDFVLRATVSAGVVNVSITGSYHVDTHGVID